jgi:predicted house-cleaning NTP pyrophosphatase (Maf/HAM1 superfamily)
VKNFFLTLIFISCAATGFCQKNLVSYDDIKYLLHNNLLRADTFLVARGYIIAKKDNKSKNREYTMTLNDGAYVNINMRSDGKRLFIEIDTDEIGQYNLLRESISEYLNKDSAAAGIQSYSVKELGNIYIIINDTVPYSPIKKDYDIQVVGDKNITAYD